MDFPGNLFGCPEDFSGKELIYNFDDYGTNADMNEFILEAAQRAFSKSFVFQPDGLVNPKLDTETPGCNEGWKVYELHILKQRLNHTKSKLNTYNLSDWHKHTNFMNPAGLVVYFLKSFNIELLTQAWCKFYELLKVFPIVPSGFSGKLNTIHLCEAPGAFVCALNHYLKLNHADVEWHWMANTLNPYYEGNSLEEMINDDRFIFKTLQNWWFGEDYTGNIRCPRNLESVNQIKQILGPIHIVTADGSVDCYRDPAEQEANVSSLHYAEVTAALRILSEGGSFILKIFTIFECETLCLIYFLWTAFKSIYAHKPVVSKEGNSEIYLVCCGYVGKDKCQNILEVLSLCNGRDRVLFKKETLPKAFIEQVVKCSAFFTELQIGVIEKNIKTHGGNMSRKDRMILKRTRNTVAELFIQNFYICSLPHQSCYILDKRRVKVLNYVPKNEEGTFQDKLQLLHLSKKSLFLKFQEGLLSYEEVWDKPLVNWFTFMQVDSNAWRPVVGKSFSVIKSSKFCKSTFLRIISELKNYGSSITFDPISVISRFEDKIADVPSEYIVCVVSSEHYISNFLRFQKECLRSLVIKLISIRPHENVVIFGLPLLTQFTVGIVFTLGLSFAEVGFVCPKEVGYVLILKDLQNNLFLERFQQLLEQCFLDDKAPLSVVSLQLLCADDLYETISAVNHVALKDLSLMLISQILNSRDTD